jgi:hypothetical protein
MDYPTQRDLFRIARDTILSKNLRISRDAVERQGTDVNILVSGSAAVGDAVIGQVAQVEQGTFLDTSRGIKLDRLVFDRYNLLRKSAAPAVGQVEFTFPTPTVGAFDILPGTILATRDGRQFSLDFGLTIPDSTVGTQVTQVRSVLAGTSQQAAANTIVAIVSVITGAPADMTVTNPLATAGAADNELDEDLITRARAFFPNARRGTLSAIETAGLSVPGVRTATAFEVIDGYGRPAKSVSLVVADSFTEALVNASPTPPTYQTQSQAFAQTVFDALYEYRAAGIFVAVTIGMVQMISIRLSLSFAAGVNADATALAARAAMVSYVNSLPPGIPFIYSAAINALRNVSGLIVYGNEIISPPGNVVPAPLQVLRTNMPSVTSASSTNDPLVQAVLP